LVREISPVISSNPNCTIYQQTKALYTHNNANAVTDVQLT